jgi:uncharacterized SAM-binding protein YcdF (DUF218 family)
MDENIKKLAKIIWDYHNIRQEPRSADLIFVLCSNDIRIAEYAADLFLKNYAPLILFSGGQAHADDILATHWNVTEADKFAEATISKGVPKNKILIENRSTNTGENIRFSFKLLKEKKIVFRKLILVQKPFMLRRTYATFMMQWPKKNEIILTAPPFNFESYPNKIITRDALVHTMVGDLQRIRLYSERGFQIPQDIPNEAWRAFESLVDMGYTKHLLK